MNTKNDSEIFDLWILDSFYGDLKTYSLFSTSILGTDENSIFNAIEKYGKIWLITLFHQPIYDKEYEYELTKFWNSLLYIESFSKFYKKLNYLII